jgi:hypothetical protein
MKGGEIDSDRGCADISNNPTTTLPKRNTSKSGHHQRSLVLTLFERDIYNIDPAKRITTSAKMASNEIDNEQDLLPEQTEGYKVGEKRTLDEYHKMGTFAFVLIMTHIIPLVHCFLTRFILVLCCSLLLDQFSKWELLKKTHHQFDVTPLNNSINPPSTLPRSLQGFL